LIDEPSLELEGTGRALLENPDVRAHYLGG